MPKAKRPSRTTAIPPAARSALTTIRALKREVARLTALLEVERRRHRRQVTGLKSAADRRLTAMMQEIATLRHHEARAEALARILSSRVPGDEAAVVAGREYLSSPKATSPTEER